MRFMLRLTLVFTRRLGSFCIRNVAVDVVAAAAAAVDNHGDACGRILHRESKKGDSYTLVYIFAKY